MLTNKKRLLSLLLTIALLGASGAFAAPMTSNTLTMPKAFSTGAFGSNDVPDGKSPTTGLDFTGEYRPVVVQVSNDHSARPHINMSEADVVYEAIYWGPAHTRYTLVFNDNHPAVVGSVRSARVQHCEIRQEWDAPFVFWGGQTEPGTNIYDYFKGNAVPKDMLFNAVGKGPTRTSDAFYRDTFKDDQTLKRVSPHDAVVNLQRIMEQWPNNSQGSAYQPKSHAYKFSNEEPSRGQDTAREIKIKYDADGEYFPSYQFNAADRVYERFYDGKEQYDGMTKKRIVASNVIVQFCDLTFAGGAAYRPMTNLIGSGVMDAFIDGRHIRGTWSRASKNDRTIFSDINGNEITMLPGKTFIQILPTYMDFTYVTKDGVENLMNIGSDVPEAKIDDFGNEAEMQGLGDE